AGVAGRGTQSGGDLFARTGDRAEGDRALPLIGREIVVRHGRPRRSLIRGAVDPEPRREPMQIVDIVGEEVGPFEPLPLPDRRVDIDAAPARHLARACAVDAIGNRLALAHRAPSPARAAARPADETAKPSAGTYHARRLRIGPGGPARNLFGRFSLSPVVNRGWGRGPSAMVHQHAYQYP